MTFIYSLDPFTRKIYRMSESDLQARCYCCNYFLCLSDRLMLLLYTVTLSLCLLLKLNDDDDDDDIPTSRLSKVLVLQTYKQTNRHTHATEIIYYAAWRVVSETSYLSTCVTLKLTFLEFCRLLMTHLFS